MTNSHSTPTHDEPTEQMAEPDSVDIRSIVGYAIGLAIVTIVSHFAMVLTYNGFAASTDATRAPRVFPLAADQDSMRPPEPRLQSGMHSDNGRLLFEQADHNPSSREALQELRAEEDAVLDRYAWVDRNASVVRLPIADAMKLALQRGFPAREAAPSAAPAAGTPERGGEQGK
jgi:hypothetical protein